jgi:hypothetical protein
LIEKFKREAFYSHLFKKEESKQWTNNYQNIDYSIIMKVKTW